MSIRIQGLSTGIEKMSAGAFYRAYNCWKDSDVSATNFKTFSPKEALPLGSCLHLLDNFKRLELHENLSDIPDLNLPFINNENMMKIIYHQSSPDVEGWIKSPIDYIFKTTQLQRNLMNFTSMNSGKFTIRRSILDMASNSPSLAIINHNPVFRLQVRGSMPLWRNTEHFINSILNTISKLPNKTHYVVIPLAPKLHVKSKFSQISNRITSGAISDKSSYQYCLFAHLYNFINVDCNLNTPFDSIPSDQLKNINLVFEVDGNYLFWSLDMLKALNDKNKIYNRIFNHFNGFILKGIVDNSLASKDISSLVSDTSTNSNNTGDSTEQAIAKVYMELTKSTEREVYGDDTPTPEVSRDDEDLDEIIKKVENYPLNITNTTTDLSTSDVVDIVNKEEGSEPQLSIDDVEVLSTPPKEGVPAPDINDIKMVYDDTTSDTVASAIRDISPITTPEGVVKVSQEYLSKIDDLAIEYINKNQELTPAQKDRAKKMAVSYKTVTIDGISIEEILKAQVDPGMADVADISILKDDPTIDNSMLKSSIMRMDDVYMKKMHKRHLASIASSFAAQGMYLQSVEKGITNTELSQTEEYTFRYKTVSGKSHTVKFSMPIVRPDGTFLINGVRSAMSKQLTTKPITKISPTRVSLASNYNKTIVEKQNSSAHNFENHFNVVMNYIIAQNPKAITDVVYGIKTIDNTKVCGYEYATISSKYDRFTIQHANQPATSTFFFDGTTIRGPIPKHLTEAIGDRPLIWIGTKRGQADFSPAEYYMDTGSVVHMVGTHKGKPFHFTTSMLGFIQDATKIYHKKRFTEWTDIKILDAKFPIGFLLCYRYGLLRTLRMLNVKYKIINTRARRNMDDERITDIVIPFANSKAILIPRYPLKTSLIIQGLAMFNTRKGDMEDFEHKDIYYQLLLDKNLGTGRTNYLIGIDDTFDMFIDPMTYERLRQMGEPTEFGELLIRATEMLVSNEHKGSADMYNHYVRSYERMNAILYNEMSAQMRVYKRQRGSNNVYSINPHAVLQRILQDQTVMMVEDLNPIHDIKTTTKLTYLGMGGRTSEAFTEKDRKFPKDGIGILSESTPSASNVGIVTQSSVDPTITNIYGIIDTTKDPKDMPSAKLLSVSGVLLPGITHDDQLWVRLLVIVVSFLS